MPVSSLPSCQSDRAFEMMTPSGRAAASGRSHLPAPQLVTETASREFADQMKEDRLGGERSKASKVQSPGSVALQGRRWHFGAAGPSPNPGLARLGRRVTAPLSILAQGIRSYWRAARSTRRVLEACIRRCTPSDDDQATGRRLLTVVCICSAFIAARHATSSGLHRVDR